MPVPVETVPDVELIQHLDFESSLSCEEDDCETRAEWVHRFVCCGQSFLKCGDHRAEWIRQADLLAPSFRGLWCLYCGFTSFSWRDFVKFIPIGAGS